MAQHVGDDLFDAFLVPGNDLDQYSPGLSNSPAS